MILGHKAINGVEYVVAVSPYNKQLTGIYRQETDGRMIPVMSWIRQVEWVYLQLVNYAKEISG